MRRSLQRNGRRLAVAKVLFVVVALVVGARAFQLQVLQGDRLMRLGQRQHLKEWIVLPKRGAVIDRTGEPLALSLESQSVYVRPHRIQNVDNVSRKLAEVLSLRVAEVKQKITAKKPFVWIKRQISSPEADKIQALNIDGIGMFYEPNRHYPPGSAGRPSDRLCRSRLGRLGRLGAQVQRLHPRRSRLLGYRARCSRTPGFRSGGRRSTDSSGQRHSFDARHRDSTHR